MDEELIERIIKEGKIDQINTHNLKELEKVVPFLASKDSLIRKRAAELILNAPVVPSNKILLYYIQTKDEFILQFIIDNLSKFLAELAQKSLEPEYTVIISNLLKLVPVEEVYRNLVEISEDIPFTSAMAELLIRTCYPAFANVQDTLISFSFIENNKKEIRRVLLSRLNSQNTQFVELVLKTVCMFPDLAILIEKEIKNFIANSDKKELILYSITALTNIQNPKNATLLTERLEKRKSQDEKEVKLALIEAIGNLANPKTAKNLVKQFEEDEEIAYHTAKALGMMGPDILPELTQALANDFYVPYVVEAMKRIGDASFDYLMTLLDKEKNSKIKKNVAQCLTLVMNEKYGYEGAIRLLVNELATKNRSVIESVTQALITLGIPSIEILIEELHDKDLQIRKNAVKVLDYFGKVNIEIALDGLLDTDVAKVVRLAVILYLFHPSKELRDMALSFIYHKGKLRAKTPDLLEIVTKATTEFDPNIRIRACDLLVAFKSKAVDKLTKLLSDSNVNVKRKAAESLRMIKSKRAIISLISAAEDKDAIVSEISTRALGELGDPGAIDTILFNLKRSKKSIYDASVYALQQIGHPIVPRLLKEIDNSNKQVVEGVIEALSQMDSKSLDIMINTALKQNEKWFSKFEQVIRNVGTKAIPTLRHYYKKAKTQEAKGRLLKLLANAKDYEIVEDLVEIISSSKPKKQTYISLNLLGKEAVPEIKKAIAKLDSEKRKTFIRRLNKVDPEISELVLKD